MALKNAGRDRCNALRIVEIYAGNQHAGGGASASSTTINGIAAILLREDAEFLNCLRFVVSSKVYSDLLPEIKRDAPIIVRDDLPKDSFGRLKGEHSSLRLVLRGPEYLRCNSDSQLCGFADASTVRPNGHVEDQAARSSSPRWKSLLKRQVLKRYDGYVVQTKSAARRLAGIANGRPVHIIPNSIHPALLEESRWSPRALPVKAESEVWLCYPAGPMPHKNHRLLHPLGRELQRRGIRLKSFVTLDPQSPLAQDLQESEYIYNVGKLSVSELPSLYLQTDGVIFPSLLETFSSVSVEAMLFQRPMFAFDLAFTRDVAWNYPLFAKSISVESMADQIQAWAADGRREPTWGRAEALRHYSPWVNAFRYLRILGYQGVPQPGVSPLEYPPVDLEAMSS
jgi:hypothetical protein